MFFFINKKITKNKAINLSYYSLYFFLFFISLNIISSKLISNIQTSDQICSITTYDNKSVTEECNNGPKKKTRILEYKNYSDYMSNHTFKENGLPFYSSLYVDTDYHNLGDFMNGGMVIYILFLISIILLIIWIPILCCWKHQSCLFDECIIQNNCCFILWECIVYISLGAVLSFIIVCIIFAE